MKTKLFLYFAVILSAVSQADEALHTSSNVVAFLDTSGTPHAVLSAADGATLTYRSGESISVYSSNGAVAGLMEAQGESGVTTWIPEAGGVYVLSNSVSGATVFSVRYSDFGAQGSGDMDNPMKIMDDSEVSDLVDSKILADGMYFVLSGPAISIGSFHRPSGCAIGCAGENLYRIVTVADGKCYMSRSVSSVIETMRPGPDRRIHLRDALAIAYSGDLWIADSQDSSTLSIEPPSGSKTENDFKGSGSTPFCPTLAGMWKVTLKVGDTIMESNVSVIPHQFSIVIR